MTTEGIERLDVCQGNRKIYLRGREVRVMPVGPPKTIEPLSYSINDDDIVKHRNSIRKLYGFATGCIVGSVKLAPTKKAGKESSVLSYAVQLYWYQRVKKED